MSDNVTEAKKALIRAIVFDGYHTTRMKDADVGDHIIAKLGDRLDALIAIASQQSVPNSVVEALKSAKAYLYFDEVGGRPVTKDERYGAFRDVCAAIDTLKQSGQTEARETCSHGIRHPWQCDECDRENPMPEGYDPLAKPATEGQTEAELLREALEAIIDRGPERDVKWAGMSAKDIARQALAKSESEYDRLFAAFAVTSSAPQEDKA